MGCWWEEGKGKGKGGEGVDIGSVRVLEALKGLVSADRREDRRMYGLFESPSSTLMPSHNSNSIDDKRPNVRESHPSHHFSQDLQTSLPR